MIFLFNEILKLILIWITPKKICLLSGLLILNLSIGQTIKITVKDTEKKPLMGATVSLTNLTDSTINYSTTNQSGIAEFNKIKNGIYITNISYIGFESLEKTINIKSSTRDFEFELKGSAFSLDEVTISAARPLIRYEYDKMIIDPEPISDISTNTLEVLESTPGLYVDQDGNIYLSGVTPATVYINDREQKMSNEDIATILRSLPPESIERIEVMRTPSTKYDAASTGGIVNIILKKGVKIGRFGSVRAGMNQGVLGNRHIGFSFNNSSDNSTTYLNVNYNHNARVDNMNSVRYLKHENSLSQEAVSKNKSNQFFTGYGINYDIRKNLNVSYDGRINLNYRNSDSENTNIIETGDAVKLFEINNITYNNSDFLSVQQDAGIVFKLDTLGSEWDTKFSYSYNSSNTIQDYYSDYIYPDFVSILRDGNNIQKRHFLIAQSDLTYHLPYEIKLETGIKTSYQDYNSSADYFINYNNTERLMDSLKTNAFNYQENINAAYIQAAKPLGENFMLIGGVRMEHTYMEGNQTIPVNTNFTINRADLFPYVYLSRSLFKIADIELKSFAIYRKTINRPGYQNLNPYIRYVDQFLYESGNPALKPQFTDNIEINISFDDTPLFAIGRNYTDDIFSSVLYQHENQEHVAVRTFDNLGKNRETYFRLILGIPPGKKYFFAVGSMYNYNEYDGVYENQTLSYKRGSWRFFTFHSLRLFKETRLVMSGFMMTNGQFNFYELKTFGQLNFGLTQTFLNKKLTVTLSARDVFRTMVTEFTLNQGSIYTYGDRYTDNRRFGVNIRYNFGIRKKEEKRPEIMEFDFEE